MKYVLFCWAEILYPNNTNTKEKIAVVGLISLGIKEFVDRFYGYLILQI